MRFSFIIDISFHLCYDERVKILLCDWRNYNENEDVFSLVR